MNTDEYARELIARSSLGTELVSSLRRQTDVGSRARILHRVFGPVRDSESSGTKNRQKEPEDGTDEDHRAGTQRLGGPNMQARGIVPRRDDKVMANPAAIGYFIGVTLRPDLDLNGLQVWLQRASALVAEVTAPAERGEDLADVAVGFSPSLFVAGSGARFEGVQVPAGFARLPSAPGAQFPGDVVFYLVSVSEARAAGFLAGLWDSRPDVTSIFIDRGYQRLDETETFGYKDGLRNIPSKERSLVAFVNRDERQPEEPIGADGGSYLAYLKIVQNTDAFRNLDPETQDSVIGRRRDGTRQDNPAQGPRDELEMPNSEPPSLKSHVRKVGPRGPFDQVRIFRRGLPFIECTQDGQVRAGLHFVSFQASLDQFDVIFNDWMMNPLFPTADFAHAGTGVDALMDPGAGLTTIERFGFFFCPPHDERHLGATLFDPPREGRASRSGRVAIRKRVTDANNAGARFERGGFSFQLLKPDTQEPASEVFVTDSLGHALSGEVPAGTYLLRELPAPDRPNIQVAQDQQIELKSAREVVHVENTVTSPGPYGSR